MEPLLLRRGQYLHLGDVQTFFLMKLLFLLETMFVSDFDDLAAGMCWTKSKINFCLKYTYIDIKHEG